MSAVVTPLHTGMISPDLKKSGFQQGSLASLTRTPEPANFQSTRASAVAPITPIALIQPIGRGFSQIVVRRRNGRVDRLGVYPDPHAARRQAAVINSAFAEARRS